MDAHAPAFTRAFSLAAEQQCEQLVTEADAEQFIATLVALEQVGLEGLDPRVGTEGVGLAARDQVGVKYLIVRGVFALHHVVDDKFGGNRLLGEQALEHLPVTLVLIDQAWTQDIGFQDADA